MSKSANFMFTLNNWQDKPELHQALDALDCKFMRYGKEVGEEGTPHLQGLVVFKYQIILKAAIKKLGGCHVEICRSLAASLVYTAKEGVRFSD